MSYAPWEKVIIKFIDDFINGIKESKILKNILNDLKKTTITTIEEIEKATHNRIQSEYEKQKAIIKQKTDQLIISLEGKKDEQAESENDKQ